MERRSCKLCSRTFANGRALGGHMRSHMSMLSPFRNPGKITGKGFSSPAPPSSSSEEGEDGEKFPCYVLRENPPKSFLFADPEFSFAVEAGPTVHDGESETESSLLPHRPRSKRRCRSPGFVALDPEPEPETLSSSVSDAATEEDVALCLMMLSRDIWTRGGAAGGEYTGRGEEDDDGGDDYDSRWPESGKRFQCETCNKVFGSYQALGGHRSSHKKPRAYGGPDGRRAQVGDSESGDAAVLGGAGEGPRIHPCPLCSRVFTSGQALGGHKRSHFSSPTASLRPKFADHLIDLNLPAPPEDDDTAELSAVSDAEFAVAVR